MGPNQSNNPRQEDFNDFSSGQFQGREWVAPVIQIVKANSQSGTLDIAAVERALEAIRTTDFFPEYDSRLRRALDEVGIHAIPRSGTLTGPYQALPDFVTSDVPAPSAELDRFFTSEVVAVYNDIFTHPQAARALAPSLIRPLLFSRGLNESSEIEPRILRSFASHLSPEAYQGFARELVRHLFGNFIGGNQNSSFDAYAEVLLGQDEFERSHIDFRSAVQHPLLTADMQCSFYNLIRLGSHPPEKLSSLIWEAGGPDFFKPFDVEEITEWLGNGLQGISNQYRKSLEVVQKNHEEQLASPNLARHENIVRAVQDRFSNYLGMIILAYGASDAFRALHQDKVDEQAKSKLPGLLAECTSGMLDILGYGDRFSVALNPLIPSRIAETREFGWYLDEHKENIGEHISRCFLRFVKIHDFRSACSMMTILPPSATEEGYLTIGQEFKDLIETHQRLICKSVVESINLVADLIVSYIVDENLDPFFPEPSRNLRRSLYETEFEALKMGIPFLLNSLNRRGEGDPELRTAMIRLVNNFIYTEPPTSEFEQVSTTHRGFALAHTLLETLGREGRPFAGQILASVFEKNQDHRTEFFKYLEACNGLAGILLSHFNLNGEATSSSDGISPQFDISEIPLYEKRVLRAVKLYEILPHSDKKLFWPPENCQALAARMSRGREIRQLIS